MTARTLGSALALVAAAGALLAVASGAAVAAAPSGSAFGDSFLSSSGISTYYGDINTNAYASAWGRGSITSSGAYASGEHFASYGTGGDARGFLVFQLQDFLRGAGPISDADLVINAGTVTGPVSLTFSVFTGTNATDLAYGRGAGLYAGLSGGTVLGTVDLAPADTFSQQVVRLDAPALTSYVASAIAGRTSSYVAIGITAAAPAGAGAPGPVAGAGLPFIIVAGAAWIARRRRAARA